MNTVTHVTVQLGDAVVRCEVTCFDARNPFRAGWRVKMCRRGGRRDLHSRTIVQGADATDAAMRAVRKAYGRGEFHPLSNYVTEREITFARVASAQRLARIARTGHSNIHA